MVGTAKQVFVAYPYTLYDKRAYRRVFERAGADYGVNFFFADEQITNMHILQKIQRQILISDFSIFDISGWNPNVTLELGIAYASANVDWYICYNPQNNAHRDVPSDIRGLDRIQYNDLDELNRNLVVLLDQKYPPPPEPPMRHHEAQMRARVVELLHGAEKGLQIGEIANRLEFRQSMARALVRGLVADSTVKTVGVNRGTRYLLKKR